MVSGILLIMAIYVIKINNICVLKMMTAITVTTTATNETFARMF